MKWFMRTFLGPNSNVKNVAHQENANLEATAFELHQKRRLVTEKGS
jgi:hypothetical protein